MTTTQDPNPTLILIREGPEGSLNLSEALQASLVLASFGVPMQLCLIGDAVRWLDHDPKPRPASWADPRALLASLGFYDLLPVRVDRPVPSALDLEVIDPTPEWLAQFNHVIAW